MTKIQRFQEQNSINQTTPSSPATLIESEALKSAPPPFYQVVLLNDDFTPMNFVIHIIQQIFAKDLDEATTIMWQIHYEGSGVCGIYPRDIAQTKVEQVMNAAQQELHPLQCIMEAI